MTDKSAVLVPTPAVRLGEALSSYRAGLIETREVVLIILETVPQMSAAPVSPPSVVEAETLEVIRQMASRGFRQAGCDGWRAQEMCRQIEALIASSLPVGD
jgi:hypothetical protein